VSTWQPDEPAHFYALLKQLHAELREARYGEQLASMQRKFELQTFVQNMALIHLVQIGDVSEENLAKHLENEREDLEVWQFHWTRIELELFDDCDD
jgi:hypothetical protein